MKPKGFSIMLILFIAVNVAIATCNCKAAQPVITDVGNVKTDSGVWVSFPATCKGEQLKPMFFSYDTIKIK